MMRLSWFLLGVWGLISCGNKSVNRVWVSPKDQNRFDVLVVKAQVLYDRGEFDAAIDPAQAAYNLNPTSEKAAQILAFSKLGQIGLSMTTVIKLLINMGADKNLSDFLATLKQLFNLTDQDLLDMSAEKAVSANSYFVGLDLYLPKKPGEYTNASDPRGKVKLLRTANEVIAIMCPFVPTELRGTGKRYECTDAQGSTVHGNQTLLLHAMAHLAEAVAFNALLFYSSSTAASNDPIALSNLLARVNIVTGIKTVTLGNETAVVGAVSELSNAYKVILDPTPGSMESEIIVDFNQVIQALQRIAGIPDTVVSSLNSTLEKLTTAQQTGDTLGQQAAAYQQQIVAKFSTVLQAAGSKITDAITKNATAHTAEDIKSVCDSLKIILGADAALPARCL